MHNMTTGNREAKSLPTAEVVEAWEKLEPYLATIKSEEQYRDALVLVEELWDVIAQDTDARLDSFFDALTSRIEDYENKRYVIPDASASAVLAEAIEQKGITQQALEQETGISQSTISKLLRGEREFNKDHIRRFANYFDLEPTAFL